MVSLLLKTDNHNLILLYIRSLGGASISAFFLKKKKISGKISTKTQGGVTLVSIQKATSGHTVCAARLALCLWPQHTIEELADEFAALLQQKDAAVFLAFREGAPIGFAQCQLRHDYVEGTESSPVGYLEGIYVTEGFRKTGVAKALLAACENWAQEKGCTELASDCELSNTQSLAFHLNVGFQEAGRIICFTKKLTQKGQSF